MSTTLKDEMMSKLNIREKLDEPLQALLQRIVRTGASASDEKYLELSRPCRDWINQGVKNIKAGTAVADPDGETDEAPAPTSEPVAVVPDTAPAAPAAPPAPPPAPEPENDDSDGFDDLDGEPAPKPAPEPVTVAEEPAPPPPAPKPKPKPKPKPEPAPAAPEPEIKVPPKPKVETEARRTRRRRTDEQKMRAMHQLIELVLANPDITKNEAVDHLVENGHDDTSISTLAVQFYDVRAVIYCLRQMNKLED